MDAIQLKQNAKERIESILESLESEIKSDMKASRDFNWGDPEPKPKIYSLRYASEQIIVTLYNIGLITPDEEKEYLNRRKQMLKLEADSEE